MSRIRSFVIQHAKVFVALFIVTVGITVYVASLPQADASGGYVCAYYSNASYTTVVGARGTGCCGQPINWGVTTKFKRCEVLNCTQQECGI